jgi:amino-acid N-acetyltransferase
MDGKPRKPAAPVKLLAEPLPHGERGVMAKALAKANLPAADVDAPGRLFWRFHALDQVPLGYGGLEIHRRDALLRSVLTLPPARRAGVGRAIVAALEVEAAALACQRIWLLTSDTAEFFARLGYAEAAREEVPEAIRASAQWQTLCPASATVMTKLLPRRPRQVRQAPRAKLVKLPPRLGK